MLKPTAGSKYSRQYCSVGNGCKSSSDTSSVSSSKTNHTWSYTAALQIPWTSQEQKMNKKCCLAWHRPPPPPFVCTVIVIILLHLVWQHIAEISVVKKYWLILSKVWMFTMTLTSRLQSKTPSWRARQVVKHMSDLGNQHHNGPHEDQSFNNPFALCLWLWAKN